MKITLKQNTIIESLQEQGFRITRVRRALLEIFHAHSQPLSVSDLISFLLKKDISVNKTTVYRELSFLMEMELIDEIEFGDGKKRYEVADDSHHHHIVCISCGRVEDIDFDVDLEAHEAEIARKTQFKIEEHSIEFFGYCQNCKIDK